MQTKIYILKIFLTFKEKAKLTFIHWGFQESTSYLLLRKL